MRVTLLGPPGAGKGTLAGLLKDRLGVVHISTGDLLREEMKNDTELGKQAKKFIEDGELVPDELVVQLIEKRLSASDAKNGYMLDGFPRNKVQAEILDGILEKIGCPLQYALYLEATAALIIKRLTGRRVCKGCGAVYHVDNRPPKQKGICDECGSELYQRADDNEETISNRMDVYLKNTTPMVDYYGSQDKLKRMDGDKESEDLEVELMKIIDEG